MVEFAIEHLVDELNRRRLDSWIQSPSRGPIDAVWRNTPVPDRREILWGVATQLADLTATRASSGVQPPTIGYIGCRMVSEHRETWTKFTESYDGHPEGLRRKIYRMAEALTGAVTTVVVPAE